jgi:hypothetical protein
MREPIRDPVPEEARERSGPAGVRFVEPVPTGAYVPAPSAGGLVEWAPSWGGMFVTLGIALLLGSLGLAIGIGKGGNAAAIWGAITALVAFFVGGWFCGRTLDVLDSLVAAAHGVLVWAITLIFTLLFTVATALVSANTAANAATAALGTNLLGVFGLYPAAPSAAQAAQAATTSSVVAFIALLLTLIVCIVGALVGNAGRFVRPARQ